MHDHLPGVGLQPNGRSRGRLRFSKVGECSWREGNGRRRLHFPGKPIPGSLAVV